MKLFRPLRYQNWHLHGHLRSVDNTGGFTSIYSCAKPSQAIMSCLHLEVKLMQAVGSDHLDTGRLCEI